MADLTDARIAELRNAKRLGRLSVVLNLNEVDRLAAEVERRRAQEATDLKIAEAFARADAAHHDWSAPECQLGMCDCEVPDGQ